MPKVSIIIPVYNVENYIRQTLESVVNQTLQDIEIICINDCTPDNSAEILSEYAQKDSRIKIITLKRNGGLGNARNVALREIKSDYVMFLDSDDWLDQKACELAYNKITKNNDDFVLFGLNNYQEKDGTTKVDLSKIQPYYKEFGETSFSPEQLTIPFLDNAFCWYKIYRTKFLLDNKIEFCTTLYEDQLFNVKLFLHAKSISVLNLPLYYYRRRHGSITQNPETWQALLSQKKKNISFLNEINIDKETMLFQSSLITAINSLRIFYRRFSKINPKVKKVLYDEMRYFYRELDSQYNIEKIKDFIDISNFKDILKYNYYFFIIKNYLWGNIREKEHAKN